MVGPAASSMRATSAGVPASTGRPPVPALASSAIRPGALPARGAPSGADAVAPPPVAPIDPGERFEQVLKEHAGPSLSRLPQRFEPIARAILPRPDQVRVSTGTASRKALSSVGKVAATSGNIVHLARDLDDSPQSIDILAHELTHVANPSPLVRFFNDDRDSKEERLANEMGSVMAKAPVGTPPASPPPPPAGRSPQGGGGSSGAGTSWGPGNMPPLPPTPPSFGGGAGAGESTPTPPPAGAAPGLLAPWANQDQKNADGEGAAGAAGVPTLDVDRLLDALESRIIRELERRGRRWPRPM